MRVLELINKLKQFDLDKKIIFYKLEKGGKTKIKVEQILEDMYEDIIINMDDNLNSISEIMKPTHLQKINPLPKNKSVVPFGFGIIPTGKFVQYNKDMIPYREYIKLLRVAIKLNTYFLQDVSDMDTVVASMEIKNLQGKHQKRLYDK